MAGSPKKRAQKLADKFIEDNELEGLSVKEKAEIYKKFRVQLMNETKELWESKLAHENAKLDIVKARMEYKHRVQTFDLNALLTKCHLEIEDAIDSYAAVKDKIKQPGSLLDAANKLAQITDRIGSRLAVDKSNNAGLINADQPIIFSFKQAGHESEQESKQESKQELDEDELEIKRIQSRIKTASRKLGYMNFEIQNSPEVFDD